MKRCAVLLLALAVLLCSGCAGMSGYMEAGKLMDAGEYAAAAKIYAGLDGLMKSEAKLEECENKLAYLEAEALYAAEELYAARDAFEALGDFEDSPERAEACRAEITERLPYDRADALYSAGAYADAAAEFEALGDTRDAKTRAQASHIAAQMAEVTADLPERYEEKLAACEEYADGEALVADYTAMKLLADGDINGACTAFADGAEAGLTVKSTMDMAKIVYGRLKNKSSGCDEFLACLPELKRASDADKEWLTSYWSDGYISPFDDDAVGTAPNGKIAITVADNFGSNRNGCNWSRMLRLPKKYIPTSIAEVEYLVDVEIFPNRSGTYMNGAPAYSLTAVVTTYHYPEGEAVDVIRASAEPPEQILSSDKMGVGEIDEARLVNRALEGIFGGTGTTVDGIPISYLRFEDGLYITGCGDGWTKSVIIPEKIDGENVVGIYDGAFSDKMKLENIELPEGLRVLCKNCMGSADIKSISLPDSLEYIGAGAFSACYFLEEVEFGSGALHIGENAFSNTSLTSVEFDCPVLEIRSMAFRSADDLVSVRFNRDVGLIYDFAFEDCPALGKAVAAGLVEYVSSNSFMEGVTLECGDVLCRRTVPSQDE